MASKIVVTQKSSPRPDTDHVPDFERHRRKCTVCNHPEREAIEQLFIEWQSPEAITRLFHLPDWSTIYRHAHAAGLHRRRRQNLRFALERVLEHADSATVTAVGIVRAVRAYACLTDAGDWIEPAPRVIASSGASVASRTHSQDAQSAFRSGFQTPVESSRSPKSQIPEEFPGPETDRRDTPLDPVESMAPPISPPAPCDSGVARDASDAELPPEPEFTVAPGRISNRQPMELETGLTHSKQRNGGVSNRQKMRFAPASG